MPCYRFKILDHARSSYVMLEMYYETWHETIYVIVEGKLTLASFSNAFTSHDEIKRR